MAEINKGVGKIGTYPFAHGTTQGGRANQEDGYFILPSCLETAQQAREFLGIHFAQVAAKTRRMECGSTASLLVVTPDGWATAANIGDSPIMAQIHDTESNAYRGGDLAECHTLSNEKEAARLGMEAGADKAHVVTRSFGDSGSLSTTPYVHSYDLRSANFSPAEELYLIVASDGVLHHHLGLRDAQSQARGNIRGARNEWEVLDRLLRNSTYPGCDNATAVVANVRQIGGDMGIAMGVFDGHNGSAAVAQMACYHFVEAFQSLALQPSFRQGIPQPTQLVEEMLAPPMARNNLSVISRLCRRMGIPRCRM